MIRIIMAISPARVNGAGKISSANSGGGMIVRSWPFAVGPLSSPITAFHSPYSARSPGAFSARQRVGEPDRPARPACSADRHSRPGGRPGRGPNLDVRGAQEKDCPPANVRAVFPRGGCECISRLHSATSSGCCGPSAIPPRSRKGRSAAARQPPARH